MGFLGERGILVFPVIQVISGKWDIHHEGVVPSFIFGPIGGLSKGIKRGRRNSALVGSFRLVLRI